MGILSLFRRKAAAPAQTAAEAPAAPLGADAKPSSAAPQQTLVAGDVLLKPHITEKATRLQTENRYAFRVARAATKQEVRRAVERQYGVRVSAVRLLTVPGKERRRGRIVGRVPGYRKALVTLRAGERIEFATASR